MLVVFAAHVPFFCTHRLKNNFAAKHLSTFYERFVSKRFHACCFCGSCTFFVRTASKQLCGKHLSTFYERFVYKRFHAGCFCGSCTFFCTHRLKNNFAASIYLHFTNGLYINAFMLVAFAAHVPFLYTSPQEQLCGKHKMVEVPSTALGS